MKILRLAMVQIKANEDNPEENKEKIKGFLNHAKKENASIVLFPECSLTGYAPARAEELALDENNEIIKEIEKTADELGVAVCFGFMEKAKEKGSNGKGFYIAQELYSNGCKTKYRKTHLGTREHDYFDEGCDFPVNVCEDVKIGMQLCWESHIPQISGTYRSKGTELLLFPYASGMCEDRCKENWNIHLPARASDNGCFAAACNLITDKGGGGMAAWNARGRIISDYYGRDEKLMICDLGGELPRDLFAAGQETMNSISYFDRARDIF